MSIYGHEDCDGFAPEPQNARTKTYVDTRETLRVAKAGHTMTGNLVHHLPTHPIRAMKLLAGLKWLAWHGVPLVTLLTPQIFADTTNYADARDSLQC